MGQKLVILFTKGNNNLSSYELIGIKFLASCRTLEC